MLLYHRPTVVLGVIISQTDSSVRCYYITDRQTVVLGVIISPTVVLGVIISPTVVLGVIISRRQ